MCPIQLWGRINGVNSNHALLLTDENNEFQFLSYTTFFMGLAALPLADMESIRFSGPLMITFLSVVILGQTVGPRRWLALFIGFMGVLLIVRPGSVTFN